MSLTDDERKKLYKKLQDDINDAIAQGQLSWSNYIFNNHPAYTSTPPLPPVPTPRYPPSSGSYSSMYNSHISPTDKDARGHYPYQEPEVDEQGTLYGYKVLNACQCGCGEIQSPRYPAKWDENGELTADREPDEHSMHGIHCTKRPDHPELENYMQGSYSNPYYGSSGVISILVKCVLSGTVVETDQGFRAQHAMIVGVLYNGYWIAYQDYKERSRSHQDYNPETDGWRYITNYPRSSGKGNWNSYTWDIDPKP